MQYLLRSEYLLGSAIQLLVPHLAHYRSEALNRATQSPSFSAVSAPRSRPASSEHRSEFERQLFVARVLR